MNSDTSETRANIAHNNPSYIQMRLDLQRLHEKVLNLLEGTLKIEKVDPNTGLILQEVIKKGIPLANDIGVQNILSFVTQVVNEHTVQGNTAKDELNHILQDMHIHLAEMMLFNSQEWGIKKKHRSHIVREIMYLCYLVLTRTVDNKERESYSPTIERTSTIYQPTENKRFGFI